VARQGLLPDLTEGGHALSGVPANSASPSPRKHPTRLSPLARLRGEERPPSFIGALLACTWGAFFFYILVGTHVSMRFDPVPNAPLLPCMFGPAALAGIAVTVLIAYRPAIGALVLLAGVLLFLFVQRHRPDTWYMVPALLCPGLLALLPYAALCAIALRKPPPDVISQDTSPPHTELTPLDPSDWQDD
jgi:hypothetical protein